jgi:hypothetical protein
MATGPSCRTTLEVERLSLELSSCAPGRICISVGALEEWPSEVECWIARFDLVGSSNRQAILDITVELADQVREQ